MEGAPDYGMAQLGPIVSEQVIDLNTAGVDSILELSRLVELESPQIHLESPHIHEEGLLGASWWQLAAKRVIDIVGSLVLICLLLPVFLVVSLAIAFTSLGPVLYRQQRVGRDGRPFTMWKFRSMYDRAHEERERHSEANECSGPVFKIRNDPRMTPVGRVIRRLSIDELPQFFNVIAGTMTLVGPRPPLPEECVHYGDREMARLLVKPGITCSWQVSGRSDVDFDTWVDLDLEYIRTWTLRQDIALLVKTVPAVITGRGAY